MQHALRACDTSACCPPLPLAYTDFGFGRARKNAERFLAAFEPTYYLRRVRIFGDDIRVLRCYPGQWQVRRAGVGVK